MVHHAAPAAPDDAFAVCVVNHEQQIVFLRDGDQVGQGRDVAVHAEHAVADDHAAPVVARLADDAAQVGGIVVFVAHDARARQPAAVDNAGVVQLI